MTETHKKSLFFTVLAIIAASLGAVAYVQANNDDSSSSSIRERMPVSEIREKFLCDRITTDVLATDIYCDDIEYYYQDYENGTVIDQGDFDDPRYQARFN